MKLCHGPWTQTAISTTNPEVELSTEELRYVVTITQLALCVETLSAAWSLL